MILNVFFLVKQITIDSCMNILALIELFCFDFFSSVSIQLFFFFFVKCKEKEIKRELALLDCVNLSNESFGRK